MRSNLVSYFGILAEGMAINMKEIDRLTTALENGNDLLHLYLTDPSGYQRLLLSDQYRLAPEIREFLGCYADSPRLSYIQRRIACMAAFGKFLQKRGKAREIQQKRGLLEALKQYRLDTESLPLKIRGLTDRIVPGLPVDILDVFLLDPALYRRILRCRQISVSPYLTEFLASYHTKAKSYQDRRAQYEAQGARFMQIQLAARALEEPPQGITGEHPRELCALTDPVWEEPPLDLLDIFLLDRSLYKRLLKSPCYRVEPVLSDFLKKYSTGKPQPREFYLQHFARCQAIRSGQLAARSLPLARLSDRVETENKPVLELFLTDKKAWEEVCSLPAYQVAPELRRFLDTYRPKSKKYSKKQLQEYQAAFDEYTNRQNRQRQAAITPSLADRLAQATREGQLSWKKRQWREAGPVREQRFAAVDAGQEYVLSVFGRKSQPGTWKLRISLEAAGGSLKDAGSAASRRQLYQAVLQSVRQTENRQEEANPTLPADSRPLPARLISPQDFVVRTNLFRCRSRQHHLEEIWGLIQILRPDGSRETEKAAAAYCPECGCFFLLRAEYDRLAQKGVLLCQMVEKEVFYTRGLPFSHSPGESLLKQHGYTVKASVGLTDAQRQTILAQLMDQRILTSAQILSYLQTFQAQKRGIPACQKAIAKWEADLRFVRRYQEEQKPTVPIRSIAKTDYRQKP